MWTRLRLSARALGQDARVCGIRQALWWRLKRRWPGTTGRLRLKPVTAGTALTLRLGSSDERVFRDVFVAGAYRCVCDIPPPALVVDCGANVGFASVVLLAAFPEAELIALEPDPENFELCRANLAAFGPRARVLRQAVWSTTTGLKIQRDDGPQRLDHWAVRVQSCPAGQQPDVEAVDLLTLLRRSGHGRIGLLKLDVEGAEGELCRDGAPWLDYVDNLAVELHGRENRELFHDALRPYTCDLSRHGELTVCRNIRRAGQARS